MDLGNTDDAITALNAGLSAASAEPSLALQKGYLMATLAEATTERDTAQSRSQYASALQLLGSRLPTTHPTILRVVNELCALDIGAAQCQTPPHCRDARSRRGARPGRSINRAARLSWSINLAAEPVRNLINRIEVRGHIHAYIIVGNHQFNQLSWRFYISSRPVGPNNHRNRAVS